MKKAEVKMEFPGNLWDISPVSMRRKGSRAGSSKIIFALILLMSALAVIVRTMLAPLRMKPQCVSDTAAGAS